MPATGDGEPQFRSLAEAIPLIVWTAGPDGQTNYINGRWYQMTGTAKGECLGNSWAEFAHPDDLAVCWRNGMTAYIRGRRLKSNIGCAIRRTGIAGSSTARFLYGTLPERSSSGLEAYDSDHQMRNQQRLEEQIKERTGGAVRLQYEIKGRDVEKISPASNLISKTSRRCVI